MSTSQPGPALVGTRQSQLRAAKKYVGERTADGTQVSVNGILLNPRFDLWNHSPDAFEWGYGGSGPAQLALAILADFLEDDQRASELHQEFKRAVIAALPRQGWTLSSDAIEKVLKSIEPEGGPQ